MENVTITSFQAAGLPSPTFNLAFGALMLVSALTVGTNVLLLYAFCMEKKLRTYSNYYIINIALSDLLVGLVVMPLRSTIQLYEQGWVFGDALGTLFFTLQNTVPGVSVLGMVAICLDRYVAAFYPLQHLKYKTRKTATVVNALTWIISTSFWVPIIAIWDLVTPTNLKTENGFPEHNYALWLPANLFVVFASVVVPFLTVSIMYVKIYCRIRMLGSRNVARQLKKYERGGDDEEAVATLKVSVDVEAQKEGRVTNFGVVKPTHCKKNMDVSPACQGRTVIVSVDYKFSPSAKEPEVITKCSGSITTGRSKKLSSTKTAQDSPGTQDGSKAMRTLTFIALAFFVTWLPICVTMILVYTARDFLFSYPGFSEGARWCSYANSLVNPLAYALAQPLIRKTLRKMLCRCHQ